MLTRAEKRFVREPESFSKAQQRLYRCRINKKLRALSQDLASLVEKNDKLGLSLGVLSGFFAQGAFQKTETIRGKKEKENTLLDGLENW